MFLRFTFFSGI